MKKRLLTLMLTCVLAVPCFGTVSAATETGAGVELLVGSPNAIVGSEIAKIDEKNDEVVPVIIDERTLVPVRFIGEKFGLDVKWDNGARKVTLANSDYNIEIVIDEHFYKVNGNKVELDVPASVINERTMLPLRAMSNAIGKEVYWNDGYIYIYEGVIASDIDEKVESRKWQMTVGSNEYGVRFKVIEDEEKDYYMPCERLGAAVGLGVQAASPELEGYSDFDKHYPWSGMKLCSFEKTKDGEMIKSYEGETGFDRASRYVFVEIPKFYMKRYIDGGYEYRYISEHKKEGYILDPTFIENGRELDFVYVSAYEGTDMEGLLTSTSSLYPMTEKTRPEYIQLAKGNGKGFGIFDIRTLMTIQNLYLVEFAEKSSQKAIGNGWTMCLQPYKNYVSLLDEASTNRVVVNNTKSLTNGLFVGGTFLIVSIESNKVLYQRTITKIVEGEEEKGTLSVYFDGAPVTITKSMYIGGGAQKSGSTDSIAYHTGRTDGHGSETYFLYRTGVKYRHMENLWGNVWHYLDGINIKGGRTVFSMNMNEYNLSSENYIYHSIIQKYQADNATVGGPTEIHYLKNLGYDERYPWLALPSDYMYADENEIEGASEKLREDSFGDYYYLQDNGVSNYVHGGGFDHYWRCGLFTLRGWQNDSRAWYLYGTRLIYKPV